MLVSRHEALERVAWAVAQARSAAGGALVVVGAPGSGKSTLLEAGVARAGDALVLRTTGVPVESGLPHAGLFALLRPLAERLGALPAVQREALAVVLGLAAGPAPSPFLVGAATLTLLAQRAEQQPVLLVVDDAQWVDAASLQALAFAARRLGAERVGVLLASRASEVPAALDGLQRCDLGPVTVDEAPALLAGHDVADDVARRLALATDGNPLAMVELARELDRAQRRGEAPLVLATGPVDVFVERVRALPPRALEAAALTALAGEAPTAVLAAARSSLELPVTLCRPAEEAGLLRAGADGVRWRHPLARAAVLDALDPSRTRRLAAALAEAAAACRAPERLVVEYRLAAAEEPDEALAEAVERVAVEADGAGDHVGAARAWTRAAAVGTDSGRRGGRLLRAATSTLTAGRLGAAQELFADALAAGLTSEERALAHLARGRVEHVAGSPHVAVEEFRAAAAAAVGAPAVRACAEGVAAAMYAGSIEDAARLAATARQVHDPTRPVERFLALHASGAAACLAGDVDAGARLLATAVEEAERHHVLDLDPDLVTWVVTAPLFSGRDIHLGAALAARGLERLRLRGDLLWLPRVVRLWGVRQRMSGQWLAAHASFEEAVELSRAAEQTTQLVEALTAVAEMEAVRGEREACLAHVDELESLLARLDVPFLALHGWQVRGLLHLGLGEPTAAAAALAPALATPDGVRTRGPAVADLVEALVLDGRRDEALAAARTAPGRRAQGLVEEDDGAAVEGLLAGAAEDGDPFDAARCRLLAGERLRRAGLRREAREHLRAAADAFATAGAVPWRRRAEEELRATGEALRRADEPEELLTGAELRVASLVAEGRPTREVASLLFLSPKTVEFHLGRVYRKLGVRGRAELAARMAVIAR